MTTEQILTLILGSGVVGAVVTKLIDWARDAHAGHLSKRRAEVDRAIQERDKARTALEGAEAEEDRLARRIRRVEESLAVHRRVIIDAPCLGADHLPDYPSRESP
ncbi:hypothetical protein [Microbacterium sp. G2-8]|uniref:hypothetical protein n=1 Tax=Microbacterium sp. G2-8 TaxID=2842454 RepID=UPI001C896E57|nr:hypothetical protein [Microbacterium sp. G2-8]